VTQSEYFGGQKIPGTWRKKQTLTIIYAAKANARMSQYYTGQYRSTLACPELKHNLSPQVLQRAKETTWSVGKSFTSPRFPDTSAPHV